MQATKCQYTESELYPLGDLQPMQVVEKRRNVIRPSHRENQPSYATIMSVQGHRCRHIELKLCNVVTYIGEKSGTAPGP